MTDARAAGEPVGGLGEEAVKLLAAMSTWAQDHAASPGEHGTSRDAAPGSAAASGPGPDQGDRDAGDCRCVGSDTCRRCPVCQTVSFVRSASPELKEQLVTAGLALTTAARAVLEGLADRPARDGAEAPDVEHIDLDDEEGQPWD